MRAYLHLCADKTNDSVMWQILNEDFDLKENENFVYTQNLYNLLDDENKEVFKKSGLNLGNYVVQSTWTEHNEVWGDIRILYLRPE